MKEAYDFFNQNMRDCVGYFGDKGFLGDVPLDSLEKVCELNKCTFVDLGENFIIAQNQFC